MARDSSCSDEAKAERVNVNKMEKNVVHDPRKNDEEGMMKEKE